MVPARPRRRVHRPGPVAARGARRVPTAPGARRRPPARQTGGERRRRPAGAGRV